RRRRESPFRKTDSVAIRGLLFDFDGLLVDTETPSRLAYEELYREHGHELPLDKWATLVGTIGAAFDPDEHLEELVGRPLDRERMSQRLRAREHELCDLEDLRPGIEDYLAEAERRGLLERRTRSQSGRALLRCRPESDHRCLCARGCGSRPRVVRGSPTAGTPRTAVRVVSHAAQPRSAGPYGPAVATIEAWARLDGPWREAFRLAWEAFGAGTIPIGAVVVDEKGTVVARGRNRVFETAA